MSWRKTQGSDHEGLLCYLVEKAEENKGRRCPVAWQPQCNGCRSLQLISGKQYRRVNIDSHQDEQERQPAGKKTHLCLAQIQLRGGAWWRKPRRFGFSFPMPGKIRACLYSDRDWSRGEELLMRSMDGAQSTSERLRDKIGKKIVWTQVKVCNYWQKLRKHYPLPPSPPLNLRISELCFHVH